MRISKAILVLNDMSKQEPAETEAMAALLLGREALMRIRENRGKDLDPKNRNLPGEND